MGTLAFRFQDEHRNDQLANLLREKHIRFTQTKTEILFITQISKR